MRDAVTGSKRRRGGQLGVALVIGAVLAMGAVLLSACGSATGSQTAVVNAAGPTAAAANWQRCQPGQLQASVISLGAATGHVGAEIVIRNTSASACQLDGYPGLTMLSAQGAALPTTVHRGGSFLFPAVAPRLVRLAAGRQASFDVEYGDNPTGSPAPPYQQACPAAATLEIIAPGDAAAVRASVTMAPCHGDLTVSPVVGGTSPLRFSQ